MFGPAGVARQPLIAATHADDVEAFGNERRSALVWGLRRLERHEIFGDVVPDAHPFSGILEALLHCVEKSQTLQLQFQGTSKQVHGVGVLILWHAVFSCQEGQPSVLSEVR